MTERPLIAIKREEDVDRQGKRKPFPPPARPAQDKQVGKFSPKFERLGEILSRPNASLELRDDPTGIAPDRALVFEVVSSMTDFAQLAKSAGLEFLGSFDEEYEPDEDFYYTDKKTGERMDKALSGVVYLAMPDLRAMRELHSLWKRYKEGRHFERGQGQWRGVFESLKEIRPWGPQDRVTDGFLAEVESWLGSSRETSFIFEVDLWFSDAAAKQQAAMSELRSVLNKVGGRILHHARIPEVMYYGALVELPHGDLSFLLDAKTNPLAWLDTVMHLSPKAMSSFATSSILGKTDKFFEGPGVPPVAAMLDGYPYVHHNCLAGRVVIDDFLELEQQCPAANRHHGTAMASLILHGDLHSEEQPLDASLIVMPVLQAVDDGFGGMVETTPRDKLAIDVIYNAIKRLKEGTADQPAIGPEVVIVNHSLGNVKEPYSNRISAWAKVIDYLAFKHDLLFVISAGNHIHKLPIPSQESLKGFESLSEEALEECYFESLAMDMRNRSLLSPAEAINAMTVGAWHADLCAMDPPQNLVNVLPQGNGPSLVSAMGLGHKRAIKPDLYYDGGRVLGRVLPGGDCCVLSPVVQPTRFAGQCVASPSAGGERDSTTNLCGTSNAAALITRRAIQLNDMLDELGERFPDSFVPRSHRAVMLKALLGHGCCWPSDLDKLDTIIEPQGGRQHSPRRTNIARLIGLGRPDISRVMACTAQRATMIFWDTIKVDRCHKVLIPLPPSLSSRKELRRLTTTLAWISPVNPLHQQYRQAVLELALNEKECGVERKNRLQPPKSTIERGTLIHNIFEGVKAAPFDDALELSIVCRQQAGHLDDEVAYALAVSFEVGVDSNIDVYAEVCAKLGIALQERVTT